MSSTNGSSKPNGAKQVPASAPHHSTAVNGHETRPAEETTVIDQSLDEHDARVLITLDLHGRAIKVAEVQVDRLIFEALHAENRWILLQGIQDALDEVRRAAVHKAKKKLGLEEDRTSTSGPDGGACGNEVPEGLGVHHPPPINGSAL